MNRPFVSGTTSSVPPGVAELSDGELLERCRRRDEAAVRALTTRYNQRLYRIARGIVRDDAEAEDVVQDTYVKALTGLENFRGDSTLSTWLVRIAMNEALGRLRRRRPTVEWNDDVAPDQERNTP